MRKLDIVFTKSKKKLPIGSWLICWWTKRPYSHVARGLSIKDWGHGFYQASEGKVNYEFENQFSKKHEIVKRCCIEVPDEIYDRVGKACWQEAGKPYGTMQNLGIFLVDILKRIGIRATNPWKQGRNCSELLYANVFKVLYPELDYDENTIKPHHIEEILETKCKTPTGE